MSDYFKSLYPAATARYSDKLRLLGLTEKDDPFAFGNDEKYVNDMATSGICTLLHQPYRYNEPSRSDHYSSQSPMHGELCLGSAG